MKRNRGNWTKKSEAELAEATAVLHALQDYQPVTLRQVYYQLVKSGQIKNARAAYSKLSRLLTKGRLDGLVPWDCIEDRGRSFLSSDGWSNADEFRHEQSAEFLNGYRRDLLQGQEIRPELWIEKDALSRICHGVAFNYCVPVIVARGFSSVSYLHDAARRIHRNAANGQRTRILYFGDLDPSGWAMLPAMLETFTELDTSVEAERCALTPEQVEEFRLPQNVDALKESDTRAAAYKLQFGSMAVELDALPPAVLEQIVEDSIRRNLDLSQFEAEQEAEQVERQKLAEIRAHVLKLMEVQA